MSETVKDRYLKIRSEIDRLSESSQVQILGVTKYQPLERVIEAVDAGLTLLGVNYVQNAKEVRDALAERKVSWHFIGHIQSRKAKLLSDYDCVQSLDRLKIAEALSRSCEEIGKTMEVLVEVNIGEESQKSGVLPGEFHAFCRQLQSLKGLRLRGLMVMPPPLSPVESRRPFFQQAFRLYQGMEIEDGVLSMGTSEDYRVAVEEGSNLVRLGSCLFGLRQ